MTIAPQISGIGEVAPSRRSGRTAEQLAVEAIRAALADAGVRPDEVECIVTETSLMPSVAPTDRVAVQAGLNNLRRVYHSSPVGAGILAGLGMAWDAVANGDVEHALTYFAIDWGGNPTGPADYHHKMAAKVVVEEPAGFVGPPLYFAAIAERYRAIHGLSQPSLAEMLREVALSARHNASMHPTAQDRRGLDEAGYDASPFVAEPLRGVDCSLLSDGAGAILVSRGQAPSEGRIVLQGWGYAADAIPDMDFYSQSPWLPDLPAARRAAQEALKAAGVTIDSIDLFQLYDCFSIAVPLQLEAIGRVPPGATLEHIRGGRLRCDGDLPVNTHGGLLSHGYLLGVGHVLEAIQQLRGKAGARQVSHARSAFVGAGPGRQYTALILERQDG